MEIKENRSSFKKRIGPYHAEKLSLIEWCDRAWIQISEIIKDIDKYTFGPKGASKTRYRTDIKYSFYSLGLEFRIIGEGFSKGESKRDARDKMLVIIKKYKDE